MINWHVLQTNYGEERLVSAACERLSLKYYCPMYKITWISRGRKYDRLIPLLPRYVFVVFDTDDLYQWRSVFDISGVYEILGGESPGVVLEQELEIMRKCVGEGGELNLGVRRVFAPFWEGDTVRLLDGPFAGHEVECVWTDGKIAAIEIVLLGRKTKLYYPTNLCDPVTQQNLKLSEVNKTSATSGYGQALNRKRGRRGGISSRLAQRRRGLENATM